MAYAVQLNRLTCSSQAAVVDCLGFLIIVGLMGGMGLLAFL